MEQDLSTVWERLVQAGQIQNRFNGSNGELIESGVRMTAEGPQQYAIDCDTQREIEAAIVERPIGDAGFVLQWNKFRSLKPHLPRLGLGRQRDYPADVSECLFACQDRSKALSILRRSLSLITTLRHCQWAALHNALPLDKNGHFLWIPTTTKDGTTEFPHWTQTLSPQLLEDFLILASSSTNAIVLFNSLHAGASVNHIHFHSVYCGSQTAIERAATVPIGGRLLLTGYPATALAYPPCAGAETIWKDVAKLQDREVPLNLIHVNSHTYLIPRNIDHEVVEEFPGGILAGMELSGRVFTTEESYYESAAWTTLSAALQKSTLPVDDVLRILES